MYYVPYMYPYQYPYYANVPMYNYGRQHLSWTNPSEFDQANESSLLTDYGPNPFVININAAAKHNNTYRTALWTGSQLQVTLMSIEAGEDIGLEMHSDADQFLRVEQGQGVVRMGQNKNEFTFERNVYDDSAIIIPAGTWHNLINTGSIPLKLYSIYAPPNHPFGTVHVSKTDAMEAEES